MAILVIKTPVVTDLAEKDKKTDSTITIGTGLRGSMLLVGEDDFTEEDG